MLRHDLRQDDDDPERPEAKRRPGRRAVSLSPPLVDRGKRKHHVSHEADVAQNLHSYFQLPPPGARCPDRLYAEEEKIARTRLISCGKQPLVALKSSRAVPGQGRDAVGLVDRWTAADPACPGRPGRFSVLLRAQLGRSGDRHRGGLRPRSGSVGNVRVAERDGPGGAPTSTRACGVRARRDQGARLPQLSLAWSDFGPDPVPRRRRRSRLLVPLMWRRDRTFRLRRITEPELSRAELRWGRCPLSSVGRAPPW